MWRLDSLGTIQKRETHSIKKYLVSESKKHPGRMRGSLVEELLCRYPTGVENPVIADPMCGVGTTGLISINLRPCRFIGAEMAPQWARIAIQNLEAITTDIGRGSFQVLEQDASTVTLDTKIDLLLTSPPFPNSHSQGYSHMQKGLRSEKSTFAGTEFNSISDWGMGSHPKKHVWTQKLMSILLPWIDVCNSGAPILVHVKNFVKKGSEIRVDAWVAEALNSLPSVHCRGYHPVPLGYRSAFQEWSRYPRRLILSNEVIDQRSYDTLECGHVKVREKVPLVQPKRAICTECGPIPGLPEVREERVVVARKR